MSFREVSNLRKSGRLDEAYRHAMQDLQEEQSEWTYSALFWVLRDYCNLYIAQDKDQDALKVFQQMLKIVENMDDDEGYAERAISSLRQQLTPFYDEVNNLSELSKNGQTEQAYNEICELHRNSPLPESLHETFGWIIYRYLKSHYQSCGSLNARKALQSYLGLKNERPSMLHSQMLNVATLISEKYEDFKFLPFLELWDVNTLSDEDFHSSFWEEKEIQPLVERIIERCFRLGYGLEETMAAFTKNERISDELIENLFSRNQFFVIYNSRSNGDDEFFANVKKYVTTINGISIKNEYHSRILSLYLWKLPDEDIADAVFVIDLWGLENFRDEDWERETDDDKEYPSLVEKAIRHYFAGLKAIRFNKIDNRFESLLRRACQVYDDDLLERNLALLLIAKGNHKEALSIYRSLLLSFNRYYVWKELAEATDDNDLRISAYCKAITLEPKDEFLGDVHLSLAKLLLEDKMYGEAKRELQTFSDTYQKNGWKLKDEYRSLMAQIPEGTAATDSNIIFYNDHLEVAEEFVYSEIEWTTMFVADVYVQKEKQVKKAKMVSADGLSISINCKKLGVTNNKSIIGKCFDVKIHSDNDKNEIVLIKNSAKQIEQLLPLVVCYVDYHNKEKNCYHLVSETGKSLVISSPKIQLKVGTFCRCHAIPQNSASSNKVQAIFHDIVDKSVACEHFPTKIGVVDGINEGKALFHCVLGRNEDIIIYYSETELRPKVGDYLSIRYISKRNKEGVLRRKMIDVKFADDCEKKYTKTTTGFIRIKYNRKGQPFGFVEDYYVPGHLLAGIEDNDYITINVVFDGEKWKAYSTEKAGF